MLARLLLAAACAAACLPAAAAHARTDAPDKPVVLVATTEPDSPDRCDQRWREFLKVLKEERFLDKEGRKIGFGEVRTYSLMIGTPGCDAGLGTSKQGVEPLAEELVRELLNDFKGEPVDIVAHGTAGVVVRAALAQRPDLAVEDVVTLGTPHDQVDGLAGRCGTVLCRQLDKSTEEGKALAPKLAAWKHPSGKGGTDWTSIGVESDELIGKAAHMGMDADHYTTYKDRLSHFGLLTDVSAERDAKITHRHRGKGDIDWGAAPHAVPRAIADLVYGGDGTGQAGSGDLPPGCTGYSETGDVATQRVAPPVDGPLTLGSDMAAIVSFASIEAISACFRKEETRGAGVYVSRTRTRVNGIDWVPEPGGTIRIDTTTRTVSTDNGRVELLCVCESSPWPKVIQFPGGKQWSWQYPNTGGTVSGDGSVIKLPQLTFLEDKLKAAFTLATEPGKTTLEVSLELPTAFGGTLPKSASDECKNGADDDTDGEADAKDPDCAKGIFENGGPRMGPALVFKQQATNMGGTKVEKIAAKLEGEFALGKLRFKGGAGFSFDFAESAWEITGKTTLPLLATRAGPPEISVVIAGKGSWVPNKIVGEVSNLNRPGPWGLFWQRFKIGGKWGAEWEVVAGVGISVGPRVEYDGSPLSLLELDGDVTVTPVSTKLEGKIVLLGFDALTGSTEFVYNDSIKVSAVGNVAWGFPKGPNPAFFINGKLGADLKIGYDGSFDGSGSLTGCYAIKTKVLEVAEQCQLKFRNRVSKQGEKYAASLCRAVDLGDWGKVEVGAAVTAPRGITGPWTREYFLRACDVDRQHAPASGAQASGPGGFSLSGGDQPQVVAVRGAGGVPSVVLSGPGGARVVTPAAGVEERVAGGAVVRSEGDDTAYVVLGRPAAGRWSVAAQPGSVPVAGVTTAGVLPEPRVRASVRRAARRGSSRRVLRWDVRSIPGQEVVFSEVGGTVRRVIARVRGGGRGSRAFVPAEGLGGRRRIVATVLHNDSPRRKLAVASYVAPRPPAVARPGAVRFHRRGETVEIRWGRARNATGYGVAVRARAGRTIHHTIKPGAPRTVRVTTADARGLRVAVTGRRAFDGAPGPVRIGVMR